MMDIRKILLIVMLTILPFSAHAQIWSNTSGGSVVVEEQGKMNISITVNSTIKIQMSDVPTTGSLDVFSILGVKVKTYNLQRCAMEGCYVELPKGLYIFKAGSVTQKIVVK